MVRVKEGGVKKREDGAGVLSKWGAGEWRMELKR